MRSKKALCTSLARPWGCLEDPGRRSKQMKAWWAVNRMGFYSALAGLLGDVSEGRRAVMFCTIIVTSLCSREQTKYCLEESKAGAMTEFLNSLLYDLIQPKNLWAPALDGVDLAWVPSLPSWGHLLGREMDAETGCYDISAFSMPARCSKTLNKHTSPSQILP